jgi:hypothetical protein
MNFLVVLCLKEDTSLFVSEIGRSVLNCFLHRICLDLLILFWFKINCCPQEFLYWAKNLDAKSRFQTKVNLERVVLIQS